MPDILVDVLRDYRKAQLELRVRLGAGKLHDNDLLFADLEGAPHIQVTQDGCLSVLSAERP